MLKREADNYRTVSKLSFVLLSHRYTEVRDTVPLKLCLYIYLFIYLTVSGSSPWRVGSSVVLCDEFPPSTVFAATS